MKEKMRCSNRCMASLLHNTQKDTIKLKSTRSMPLRRMSHLQFYRAILSRNFIARQYRKCDMPCRTLQLCRINKNWPISVHRIFATKLRRIERCSNRKMSCATVEKLRHTPCHTCDFVAQLYRATKWYVWHAVLHIATLSPKQELKLVNLAVGLQYRVWTCL